MASSAGEVDSTNGLPEEKLNIAIVITAFGYKVMNSLGMLATIWATVVLLGGFATLIKGVDFWYVTVIAFVQSLGILRGYEDPFMRASEALLGRTAEPKEKKRWRRRNLEREEKAGDRKSRRARKMRKIHRPPQGLRMDEFKAALGNCMRLILFMCQVAAVVTCIFLSSSRLKKQDFTKDVSKPQQDITDYNNISRSLKIFYGLVVAQGIIFILWFMNLLILCLRAHTRFEYKLFLTSGRNIVTRYTTDNFLEFIAGNVRPTLNMNLITFAKNLVVSSSSRDDQVLGIKAMDVILRSVEYRRLALVRFRASLDTDALDKLLNLLGLSWTTDEQLIRGHAARVVLKLTPDLLVENFPKILRLISSSLLPKTSSMKMSNMDVDLVWFGLRILDKLTDNPDNCRQVKDHGDLLSKIIDLTNLRGHGTTGNTFSDSWIEQEIVASLQKNDDIPPASIQKIDQEIIVGMSLNILSKLIATPGAGVDLRRETSEHFRFLSHTGIILEHVQAIRIISCLAVDPAIRKEIGIIPEVIKKLKDCLFSKPPYVNISKVAAKLLLLYYISIEQLDKIQQFIEEKPNLEDQTFSLTVSAFIEELDLDQVLPPWSSRKIQKLDLEDQLSAPRVNHSEEAAEALFLLTTGCQNNVVAFLHEIEPQELNMIVNMISSTSEDAEKEKRRKLAHLERGNLDPLISCTLKRIFCAGGEEHTRRSMLAKLLQNLRAHSGQEKFDKHMQEIDKALPKVFKAIVDEVETMENALSTNENLSQVIYDLRIKQGKILESFMGLSVEICRSVDASYFTKALDDAPLKLDTFVQKLKKILEIFRSPTTDFPSIRRSTLELMTWMVKNNASYRDILLQCGVYEQLNEVQKTARKLEGSKQFHCGVDVLSEHEDAEAHGEHGILCITSLANELREQLQLCPNFLERSRCYREPASTISVLIA